MTKLSKADIKTRDEIAGKLQDRQLDFEQALEQYNTAIHDAWASLSEEMTALNSAIAEANQWRADIHQAMEDFFSDESEKWQNSDKGAEYRDWQGEFECALDEVELEQPEDLDPNIGNLSEEFWDHREGLKAEAA
jgi:predicted  nucleic acid-binding Zn-ribbon protein